MKLNFGKSRGLMISKQTLPPGKSRKKEQVSSGEAKCCVSFLAFLTHDSTIQPKLPQVVLSNQKAITVGMLHTLQAQKTDSIRIWREKSGWTNHQVFRRLMTLLMQCLSGYSATHQVILVVDAARSHFHSTIFAHANRLGLRLVYVPAKLTWLLQPADTHLFSRLKAKLRRKWLELRVDSDDGKVSPTQWLLAVFEVAQTILCGIKWLPAFRAVGLLDENTLSARVLQQLGWEGPEPIPSSPLSEEQLKMIFPRRSRVPVTSRTSLFKWASLEAASKEKPKAKASASASAPVCAGGSSDSPASLLEGPISSRTRKRCKSTP